MKKERKIVFIIVRVTIDEKLDLIKKSGKNLSKYIRAKLGL